MTPAPEDHRAIACNYRETSRVAVKGALAYLLWPNPGGGNDRIFLLIRSRGGRWIEKWEAVRRLGNFRLKTIPPQHPLYDRLDACRDDDLVRQLSEASEREHAVRFSS